MKARKPGLRTLRDSIVREAYDQAVQHSRCVAVVKAKTKANGHPNELTLKQARFVKEYAKNGNGTGAAKAAGYKGDDPALATIAWENLRKPDVASAVQEECARIEHEIDFSAGRVRRRLDRLSHGAEEAEQYGVAVRAEELIGRAAGMFVDQSIQLQGTLSTQHLDALVAVARDRQAQPLDLALPKKRIDE